MGQPRPARPASRGGLALLLYAGQFLGAWAVFYTTLLRDMGRRSFEGTLLLLATILALGLQFMVFPDVEAAEPSHVLAFLRTQAGLAALLWISVMLRWIRTKRAWLREQDA